MLPYDYLDSPTPTDQAGMAPIGRMNDAPQTELEQRWLNELRQLAPLTVPHMTFGDGLLLDHPALLREWVRIAGVYSLGKWDHFTDLDRLSTVKALGCPVCVNWSPAERERILVPPGADVPAGAVVTKTLPNGAREAWVTNRRAVGPFHRFAARLQWLAANSMNVDSIALDQESDCHWMEPLQLAQHHDRYEREIRRWYPDAKIIWYTHLSVYPSQGVIGRSVSRYTAGTETASIAVPSCYTLSLDRMTRTIEWTAQHAALRGVRSLVPWLSPTGAYMPTFGYRGDWVQDAAILHSNPELPFTFGAVMNHRSPRGDWARWPGMGWISGVVLYRGPESRPGWWAWLIAYARGAQLDQGWREAHPSWEAMGVPRPVGASAEIVMQPEMVEPGWA